MRVSLLVKVRVYLYATLRERAGGRRVIEVDLPEGATVRDALLAASREAPGLYDEVVEDGRVRVMYKVLVDGRDVDFLEGLSTRLRDGSEVHVFPPVAGGLHS